MSANKTPLGLNNWTASDKPLMEEFNSDNDIIDTKLRELEALFGEWTNFTPNIYGETTAGTPALDQLRGSYKLVHDTCIYSFMLRVNNMLTSGMEGRLKLTMPVPSKGTVTLTAINAGSLPENAVGATFSSDGLLGYINSGGTGLQITANLIKTNRFTVHGQIIYRYK